eukprot:4131396-Amphidinium_carterae.2
MESTSAASAGRQWAESVLAGADPMGLVKSKPILRLNLQDLVASTSKAVGARRELPSTMDKWQAMVDEADVLNEAGCLLKYSFLEGEAEEEEQEQLEVESDKAEEEDKEVEEDEAVVADNMPTNETEAAPQHNPQQTDQAALRKARFLALRLVYGQPSKAAPDSARALL